MLGISSEARFTENVRANFVVSWLRGFVASWLRGFVASWLRGLFLMSGDISFHFIVLKRSDPILAP